MSGLSVEIRRHGHSGPWTYALLDQRQREIQAEILSLGAPGKILLSEVAPVVTLGRRGAVPGAGLKLTPSEIRTAGVDLYSSDRGGNATYHGPGQWVLFVVETLERLVGDPRGVKETFRRLEALTLRVAREWCAGAEARAGAEAGIWSGNSRDAKKLASFGIKVDRGVLLHGVCLNGYRTAQSFYGIDPCGLSANAGFLMQGPEVSEFERIGERLIQEAFSSFDGARHRPRSR